MDIILPLNTGNIFESELVLFNLISNITKNLM